VTGRHLCLQTAAAADWVCFRSGGVTGPPGVRRLLRVCQTKHTDDRTNVLEHSNSGEKKFRFDSIRQSDKFAASTLIFK